MFNKKGALLNDCDLLFLLIFENKVRNRALHISLLI